MAIRDRSKELEAKRVAYAIRKAEGKCPACNKPLGEGDLTTLCRRCYDSSNITRKRYKKTEGKCSCCGSVLDIVTEKGYKTCVKCRDRALRQRRKGAE